MDTPEEEVTPEEPVLHAVPDDPEADAMREAQAMRDQMLTEAHEAQAIQGHLSNTEGFREVGRQLEVSLCCALARAAFLSIANEAANPEEFITGTVDAWRTSELNTTLGMVQELEQDAAKNGLPPELHAAFDRLMGTEIKQGLLQGLAHKAQHIEDLAKEASASMVEIIKAAKK